MGKITTTFHPCSHYCIHAFIFLCIIFSYSSWQTHGDVDVWQEILCPFRQLGMLRLRTVRCWAKVSLRWKLLFLLHNSSFFTEGPCCGGCCYKGAAGIWCVNSKHVVLRCIHDCCSVIDYFCLLDTEYIK